MAIWPFGKMKRRKTTDVPEEVQEYYQSERRERVGIAWLLAIATLVTTIVLAFGLFYGGRWAWRQTFGDDQQTTTTQTEAEQSEEANNQPASQPAQNQPQATPPAEQPKPSQPAVPKETPSATPKNMAQTGPASTLAVFVGATILGALAYQVYIRRQLAS